VKEQSVDTGHQHEAVLEGIEGVAASIYRRVYHVLVAGMALSTTLFAVGILRALVSHQTVPLSTHWIREQYNWDIFLVGLRRLEPTALLMAATFVLILTPIMRVAVSVYAFAMERDRKFVAITSTVLVIILFTVVLARAGWVSPEHVAIKDTVHPTQVADAPKP
jgi:uncharacterized membrane protein